MSILNLLISAVTAVQALIPMPQQAQWNEGTFDYACPYRLENTCPDLSQNLYLQNFLQVNDAASSRVCIIQCEAMPQEGYRLHITADTLLIAAHDAAGFDCGDALVQEFALCVEPPHCLGKPAERELPYGLDRNNALAVHPTARLSAGFVDLYALD